MARYCSLDIETSSLNPHPDHVLGISMVIEDTTKPDIPLRDLPHFTCIVRREEYKGTPRALAMNAWIFEELCKKEGHKYQILPDVSDLPYVQVRKNLVAKAGTWHGEAMRFIAHHFGTGNAVCAGKNVGMFDLQFLPGPLKSMFKHRVIDPGAMFMDWSKDAPPGLGEIKKKLGLNEIVTHDMYEDALDVIEILRTQYTKDKP